MAKADTTAPNPSEARPLRGVTRRLAVLAAALTPATALASNPAETAMLPDADAELIAAARAVVAALDAMAAADARTDDEIAALDPLLETYDTAVWRVATAGPPVGAAGLAAMAHATLAALDYEVRVSLAQAFERQARPHELLAAALAKGVVAMAGRTAA